MTRIHIVTDSTADLTTEQMTKHHIHRVPLTVQFGEESYLDHVEISPDTFVHKLAQTETMPTTSQPSVGTFVELYDQLGQDGDQILSIHLSQDLSGTYSAAKQAADISTSDVTVIDSRYISQAMAFQVIKAAQMAEQGFKLEDILNRLQQMKEQTKLYIMVDTLDYLVKGGRIGKGTYLIGSLLHIKPIASLTNGVYHPFKKVRSYKQMIKSFQQQLQDDIQEKGVESVSIVHIEAQALAEQLKKALHKVCAQANINIFKTGAIIGTHTGPGAIAMMYHTRL